MKWIVESPYSTQINQWEPLSLETLDELRPELYQAIENGKQSFFHDGVLYSTLTASPVEQRQSSPSERRRAVAEINSSSSDEALN